MILRAHTIQYINVLFFPKVLILWSILFNPPVPKFPKSKEPSYLGGTSGNPFPQPILFSHKFPQSPHVSHLANPGP